MKVESLTNKDGVVEATVVEETALVLWEWIPRWFQGIAAQRPNRTHIRVNEAMLKRIAELEESP